ncbi:hypothetical protein EB796_020459 [Bugula neritina]|uniref:Uncharacterized protein n=1 Tax=Bugula neritina TaxID=10212 RepID=A0A7J7J558_BUGNE|nr:hypothetical protein EB796_020459 [Bugula neritina]
MALLVLAISLTLSQLVLAAPDFCKNLECPQYKVIQNFANYELREYAPTVWVSVDTDRRSSSLAFRKLFDYIRGANNVEKSIEMTAPVLSSYSKDTMVMSFMVPSELSENPPTPNDADVYIQRVPRTQFYVRAFSPLFAPSYGTYSRQFRQLKDDLIKDGNSYTVDPRFFTAGYDGPWTSSKDIMKYGSQKH